ncbi:MAG: hypothetical protein D6770_02740 [Anaerolineae bacterium]|nr:MAG: hypothetical protein D6770_02740 [Anaerolineae bacterium]
MSVSTTPRTQRFVQVDVLTSSYRVVGKVLVTNTGVIGLMNDVTNSFFEVHDARLARVHMPTKLVDHFSVVRMVKPRVFAVCVARREDLGPHGLVRGGFAKAVRYPVRVTTQVYELEGTLEWPGRFDFSAIMADGTRDFIPLLEAHLTAILIPALNIESPAALFNRRQVDLLALKTQRAEE